MTAANKLLDKAAERCSPANYVGLAARLKVTTSVLSGWKLGRYPVPAERIAELARIAHEDAGNWLLLIEQDQAHGEARKAYAALIERLGIAATVAGVALLPLYNLDAGHLAHFAIIPGLSIMSALAFTFLNVQNRRSPRTIKDLRHARMLAL